MKYLLAINVIKGVDLMKKKVLVWVVPIAIVVIGIIGYTLEGYGVYESLLSSLKFLKINLDEIPNSFLLELARWLGILFLFGLIYAMVTAAIERGIVLVKTRKANAVAVHGDSVYSKLLLSALGARGIKSESTLAFKAPIQVLTFERDSEALEFYQKHSEAMKQAKEVHICLEMNNHISIESDNLYLTNLSEIRAIDYWNKNYSRKPENIVIVGSGSEAEALVYWGLLTNVHEVECNNRYSVFGNFDRFCKTHTDIPGVLDNFGKDKIDFYNDGWYSHLDVIKNADRIILCDEALDNLENALDIRNLGMLCPVHIYVENNNLSALVDKDFVLFGSLYKDNIESVLLMDSVHRAGKLCHASYQYFENNKGKAASAKDLGQYLDSEDFTKSWKALDAFTKGSNYASAIHDNIKEELLKKDGLDPSKLSYEDSAKAYDSLNQKERDRLQEIEHIRWCRYLLLNNWRKAEGDIIKDGEILTKDNLKKIHRDLVPYSELSFKEQIKDSYFYKTLCLRR